jgi:signal transduction histidine kinase
MKKIKSHLLDSTAINFKIQSRLLILLLSLQIMSHAAEDPLVDMFRSNYIQKYLPDFHDSYGVVFRDLNNDNLPDIYVVRFRNLNRLFLNGGIDKHFTDVTIHSGLGGSLMPRGQQNLELGTSSADFNNDKLPDMAIVGWGESTRIFSQEKDFHFRDITARTEINFPLDGNGAFWSDVNIDGKLDLFITNEHYINRLFLGDGLGRFRDVSEKWGLREENVSQSASFGDINGDGYPDLYVCNWFAPDILYQNTGSDSFKRQFINIKHLTETLNSNGVNWGDIDNDGDLDLLVTDREGETALYRNDTFISDSAWVFTEISQAAGFSVQYPAYGSVIADLDNDSWQDIWISTVGPNMFFQNMGNGTFQKKFQEKHPFINFEKYYSTGAAVADIEGDGDLDLFISNKDTISSLYENPLNSNNYIQLYLIGLSSNRDAIGTRIWLYQRIENQPNKMIVGYREISGGSGYLSQNSLIAHFGVMPTADYEARILFPSGHQIYNSDIKSGNRYTIYEYDGILRIFYQSYNYLYLAVGQPNFFLNLMLFLILVGIIIGYTVGSTKRYRWVARHLIVFFSATIGLLYGIFIGFQDNPIYTRMIIQIIFIIGLLIPLTFFMEKIRRLEIARSEYRKLLQDFSQELIFIKNNNDLFHKLLQTVFSSVHPTFCAIYETKNSAMRLVKSEGIFEGPPDLQISEELRKWFLNKEPHFTSQELNERHQLKGHLFPIVREEKLFGLLVIGRLSTKRDFTESDLSVFRTLISQTATAIDNNLYIEETARLTQQVTESKTREKYLAQIEKANKELEESNQELKKLYKDLQETQAQLVQSEKMASLGQLVAGVAHELNNPISFIYANIKELERYSDAINRLLKIFGEENDPLRMQKDLAESLPKLKNEYDLDFMQQDIKSLISESLEGSQRVKDVVQNLRNFSRLDEAKVKTVDLHEGLESTLILLNNEIKNRITIHKNYGKIPKLECHPGNINQVFMNILLNAVQAIDNTGNIWITTKLEKDQVEIEIRDDGRGIPKKFQNKIFDPFFTNKPVGKGTGLGLSISYNIIKSHGGNVDFNSKEGEGTSFFVSLPVTQKKK